MWVCIRPQGGQDYYLLMYENRVRSEFCPIHRFDGMDQIPDCFLEADRGGPFFRAFTASGEI